MNPKEQKILAEAQSFLSQNNALSAREVLINYSHKKKLGNQGNFFLSISYAMTGNPKKANEIALKLLKKDPNEVEYLKLLGSCNHQLKNYDTAIKYFKRALSIQKSDFQTLSNLASSLNEIKDYDESEKYFISSLQLNPNQPDALTNYGLLKQSQNNLDDAISLHTKAIKLVPNHIGALYNLAYTLKNKGEVDAALNHYSALLNYMPNNIKALCDAAQIYAGKKQSENTLKLLLRAEEIEPENEEVLQNLGIAYKKQQIDNKAREYFLKAIAINPNNKVVEYYLSMYNQDQDTEAPPEEYIQGLFDDYADSFDEHLVKGLEYGIPKKIRNLLSQFIDSSKKYNILDLGCGTGLSGEALQDIALNMTGVDLSPNMIKKAEERNVYNELVVSGIEEFLKSISPTKFDIIIAADVFVYIGNLKDILSLVSSTIQKNGLFIFSTESTDLVETFTLQNTGRFAHNPEYIKQLGTENGLIIKDIQEAIIRYENNMPINGHIYTFMY